MLNIRVDNSSSMGFPSLGRFLLSLGSPDATKQPVGGSGSAPRPGRTRWAHDRRQPRRLGLRPPRPRQRPHTPAPQTRVRHRSHRLHRFCLSGDGKRTLASHTRNYVSRQSSCAPPFLGTPMCRHSNPGPRALAALHGGCLRRCLRRREIAKNPNSLSGTRRVLNGSTGSVEIEG